MGNKSQKISTNGLIQPVPGTYGAPIRKRGHITIYSETDILYLRIVPEMTIGDIRKLLYKRMGKHFKLEFQEGALKDSQTLLSLGINERSLLRAVNESTTDSESSSLDSKLSISAHSIRSCPLREASRYSPNSTHSFPRESVMDIDFSVYAVPESNKIKNKVKRKRKINLSIIHENEKE